MSESHIEFLKRVLKQSASDTAARKKLEKARSGRRELAGLDIVSYSVKFQGPKKEARIILRGETTPMVVSV